VFVTWQVERTLFGQRHLQGYLVTKVNPRNKNGFTLKWCKESFGTKAHFEPRHGTHEQAAAYANKVDTRIDGPWTVGEYVSEAVNREGVGQRVKKATLTDVKADIDAGCTDVELWERHTSSMLRYGNAFDKYRLVMSESRERDQPKVVVFWGPPGTGKSHKARAICENNGGGHWFQSGNGDNAWWDGYDPIRHPVVVLDDFKGGIKYTTLLRMLDKYPLQVETKGSTKRFTPKIIVITSNTPPNMWYFQNQQDANHDSSALLRRLEGAHGAVVEMKEKYVEPELDEPDLKDVLDLLEDGTLIPREVAVRSEYLGDVGASESRAAVAAALVDLTTSEELEESAERVLKPCHHYTLACADCDGDGECGSCDHACFCICHIGKGCEPDDRHRRAEWRGWANDEWSLSEEEIESKIPIPRSGALSPPPTESEIVADLGERHEEEIVYDDDFSDRVVATSSLKRRNAMTSVSTPMSFAAPPQRAGQFKKIGSEPIQSKLVKKRRVSNDDDGTASDEC